MSNTITATERNEKRGIKKNTVIKPGGNKRAKIMCSEVKSI